MTKSKSQLLADLAKLKGLEKAPEQWQSMKNYEILIEISKFKDHDQDSDGEKDDFASRMGSGFRK